GPCARPPARSRASAARRRSARGSRSARATEPRPPPRAPGRRSRRSLRRGSAGRALAHPGGSSPRRSSRRPRAAPRRRASLRRRTAKEAPPTKHRMLAADREYVAREGEQLARPGVERPVHPADVVVLAVRVVVALLRATELVAVAHHGDALRESEGGEEVARGPVAQGEHVRSLGLARDTPVVAPVGVAAVVVVLAVGLVVLLLVAH